MNSSIAAVTLIMGVGSGLSSAMKVACYGSGLTVVPHRGSSTDLLIRRSGASSRAVCCGACAGPTFQSCPYVSGAVWRPGNSIGNSRFARGIDPARPFQAGHIPSWRKSCERPGPR